MSEWLGRVVRRLSPRKAMSMSSLDKVETLEPHHYNLTSSEQKNSDNVKTRSSNSLVSQQTSESRGGDYHNPSSSKKRISKNNESTTSRTTTTPDVMSTPVKRKLIIDNESPSKRFFTLGLNLLTRAPISPTESLDVNSEEADYAKSESNETSIDSNKKDLNNLETNAPPILQESSQQDKSLIAADYSSLTHKKLRDLPPRKSRAQLGSKNDRSPTRSLYTSFYERKHRGPQFSDIEDKAIVDFFLDNGGYHQRGGNVIWKRMEAEGVCSQRTWQSLKQRFKVHISFNLSVFNTSVEQLERPPTLGTASDETSDLITHVDSNTESSLGSTKYSENIEPNTPEHDHNNTVTSDSNCSESANSPQKYFASVPGTKFYDCSVLVQRQASLITELRALSEGVNISDLPLPGSKQVIVSRTPDRQQSKQKRPNEDNKKGSPKLGQVQSVITNPDPRAIYKEKHRTLYTRGEDLNIIHYLIKQGGFHRRGGNLIWKNMEDCWNCPGRTWQSLRERFNKHILKHLEFYNVTEAMLTENTWSTFPPLEENRLTLNEGSPEISLKKDIIKQKRGPPYSKEEEQNIADYYLRNGNYLKKGGNLLWKDMEEMRICPGRTWQSLKRRFDVYIFDKLNTFEASVKDVDKVVNNDEQSAEGNVHNIQEGPKSIHSDFDLHKAYQDKYRAAYSHKEEQNIVDYLVRNEGFPFTGGNEIWKEIEHSQTCLGRSWQSMKSRFKGHISENIEQYGLTKHNFIHILMKGKSILSKKNKKKITHKSKIDRKKCNKEHKKSSLEWYGGMVIAKELIKRKKKRRNHNLAKTHDIVDIIEPSLSRTRMIAEES